MCGLIFFVEFGRNNWLTTIVCAQPSTRAQCVSLSPTHPPPLAATDPRSDTDDSDLSDDGRQVTHNERVRKRRKQVLRRINRGDKMEFHDFLLDPESLQAKQQQRHQQQRAQQYAASDGKRIQARGSTLLLSLHASSQQQQQRQHSRQPLLLLHSHCASGSHHG